MPVGLVATSVGRTDTALGAFYRRLAARIGKAKALTATARKIAILFYRAMRFGMHYRDPGADQYERRYRERVVKQLHRRAAHVRPNALPAIAARLADHHVHCVRVADLADRGPAAGGNAANLSSVKVLAVRAEPIREVQECLPAGLPASPACSSRCLSWRC